MIATGCEIYGFVSLVSGLSAIWFLTAISLERYRVVRLSITPSMSSKSQTRVVVWVVWMTSGVMATIPLLGWNRYVPEGVLSGCTVDYLSERWLDRSFVFLLLLVAWTAPMAAVLFSYMYIIFKVKRSRKELRQLSNQHTAFSSPNRKTGTRVAMLVGLWAISWTPYALVVLVSVTFSNSVLTPLLSTMPSVFCKASACLNPYVYGLSLPGYK
ncbi:Ocellar opsin [Portunus trituberculatus]|uniref:Ocellar opsin n=1 Tax=Portunus trituberculatus TaxID=210409 RepID=A0A5B7EXH0_PORTR|nr:Ocellar opsin [Portunus trituberculatus]